MIVNIAFDAAPGKRDDLVGALINLIPETQAFEGCNHITFTESQETPGSLLLIEDWDSHAHYDAYKQWRRDSGTSVLGGDLVEATSVSTSYFDVLDG
jgi:quinol monooxygenase YgiN